MVRFWSRYLVMQPPKPDCDQVNLIFLFRDPDLAVGDSTGQGEHRVGRFTEPIQLRMERGPHGGYTCARSPNFNIFQLKRAWSLLDQWD
jgi:hypothetical protein